MPRRTNDGIMRLHAQAAQQKPERKEKPVTSAALPPSTEPEVFDFQRYCLESYASKVAIGMNGQHYACNSIINMPTSLIELAEKNALSLRMAIYKLLLVR